MPSRAIRSRARRHLRIVLAFVFVFATALTAVGRIQARGDDAADARRHAQRASSLAASGKCRQAVAEWNKAFGVLRDPALLFNRAECYRKLGDVDAALEDYRQFLDDMPKAPNRAEVERRISELSAEKSRAPAKELPAPASPPPVVVAPSAPSPPPAPPEPSPEPAPVPAGAAPVPAAQVERTPNPALTLTAPVPSSSPETAESGVTARSWFWIAIAAVAVAAGVGTFVLLSRDSTNVPSTALGNYKF